MPPAKPKRLWCVPAPPVSCEVGVFFENVMLGTEGQLKAWFQKGWGGGGRGGGGGGGGISIRQAKCRGTKKLHEGQG